MRAHDYRDRRGSIHLIIATSFPSERDAQQGHGRVGRNGDACRRSLLEGVSLVDSKSSILNRGKLLEFY